MRNRNYIVVVHLNDKDLTHLNQQTTFTGLCRESFIRDAIAGISIRPKRPDSYHELARELAYIGNNINQLAYIANYSATVSSEQIQQVQNRMEEVWQLVLENV